MVSNYGTQPSPSGILGLRYEVEGGIPLTRVTGETTDISEYLEFGFQDRVRFKVNAGLSPSKPGRWLGASHRTGSLMTYYVLN